MPDSDLGAATAALTDALRATSPAAEITTRTLAP
jgi:hypothetical protein